MNKTNHVLLLILIVVVNLTVLKVDLLRRPKHIDTVKHVSANLDSIHIKPDYHKYIVLHGNSIATRLEEIVFNDNERMIKHKVLTPWLFRDIYNECSISPDGKLAAIYPHEFGNAGDLILRNLTTNKEVQLNRESNQFEQVNFSPDGSRVAFLDHPQDDPPSLFVKKLNGRLQKIGKEPSVYKWHSRGKASLSYKNGKFWKLFSDGNRHLNQIVNNTNILIDIYYYFDNLYIEHAGNDPNPFKIYEIPKDVNKLADFNNWHLIGLLPAQLYSNIREISSLRNGLIIVRSAINDDPKLLNEVIIIDLKNRICKRVCRDYLNNCKISRWSKDGQSIIMYSFKEVDRYPQLSKITAFPITEISWEPLDRVDWSKPPNSQSYFGKVPKRS